MHKSWLSQYGEIPAEINPNQFSSIAALYDDAFERFGSRTLAMSMDKTLTYAQTKQMSEHIGAWLQQLGLQKSDRVAVMMPNCLQYIVVVA
ncbi:MAG: AMP-binding protein, partial [Burkholderiales bacterium]|nr:AMP-binding protein [Burkholderiales bacterium]